MALKGSVVLRNHLIGGSSGQVGGGGEGSQMLPKQVVRADFVDVM